jgi:hypothetical protein
VTESKASESPRTPADELREQEGPPSSTQELDQITALSGLAERLSEVLQPVRPSAAFVQSLGRELVRDAASRVEAWKRRRRSVTIIAAVAGALLSLASLVGAIVYLTSRSRTHTEAPPGNDGS